LLAVACAVNSGEQGGNDTGSETTGSDLDTGDTDSECEGIDFPVAGHPPSVMVVLDRSASMAYITVDAWFNVVQAISDITQQMDYQIRFGLYLFPGEDGCEPSGDQPDVFVSDSSGDQIAEILDVTYADGWGTPTAKALQKASEYLVGLDDESEKIVILATDGAPNCSADPTMSCDTCVYTAEDCLTPMACLDDLGTYSKVTEYHDNWGVDTYVIGMGGVLDVWDEVLTTIAYKGGTEDFYPADTTEGPENLTGVLQGIAAANTSCTFDVNWYDLGEAVSKDPLLVNVLGDGDEMVYSENCEFEYGWHWLDDNTIELCPLLCYDYRWGVVASVHASFGCETIIE